MNRPTGYTGVDAAMPRSLWNGTISVGLINVPVKLYSAVDSKTVHFREVHIADDAKVEHRRFCSAENREVPSKAVVKGFEVGEDEYVVLSKDEIAAAAGDRAHVVAVEVFVESGAIDPVFYEKTYYLGAGKDGGDAYRLLHDALDHTGRVGLGRFTFHNREYLAAVRPLDRVLVLHTMRFADELVPGADIEFDAPGKKPRDREVQMAGKLVSSLQEDFDPARRKDEYRKAVLDMIERKAAGKKPRTPKEEPPRGRSRSHGGARREPGRRTMPRSLWSGSLSFGLVNVPVALHSAVRDVDLHFHQLHEKDAARIDIRRFCSKEDREIPLDEVAHAYELDNGKSVVVSDEELAAVAPRRTRTIDIEAFVDAADIDPIYFDHPYFLAPVGESEGPRRAYQLLVETMRRSERVALGRFVMRTKEYLVAIRARDDRLALSTMLFGDEIRPAKDIDTVARSPRSSSSSRPSR